MRRFTLSHGHSQLVDALRGAWKPDDRARGAPNSQASPPTPFRPFSGQPGRLAPARQQKGSGGLRCDLSAPGLCRISRPGTQELLSNRCLTPPAPRGLAKQTSSLEFTLLRNDESQDLLRACPSLDTIQGACQQRPPYSSCSPGFVYHKHTRLLALLQEESTSEAWHMRSGMHGFAPSLVTNFQLGKLGP